MIYFAYIVKHNKADEYKADGICKLALDSIVMIPCRQRTTAAPVLPANGVLCDEYIYKYLILEIY